MGLPAELGSGGEQAVEIRRQPPRERFVAFDHLEQRLLLPEEVLLGSGHHGDLDAFEPAGLLYLREGAADGRQLGLEAGLQRDERVTGADSLGGDQETLEHGVGVGAHEGAVFERARLAFGSVGHGVARAGPTVGDRAPLDRSGEPRSAAPTQSSSADLADDLGRSDVARADQAGAAAVIEIRAE